MRALILLSILLLSTVPALAKEVKLCTIQSDYNEKKYDLVVEVNENNHIEQIITKRKPRPKIKRYPTTVLDKEITLVKTLGITIVGLTCHKFSPSKGCPITINYPSNIALGSFKDFNAEIRVVNGEWKILANNRPFQTMSLKSKRILGLLVGIKSIELI